MHEDSVIGFGGSFGIRDENLLESALMRAQNMSLYEATASVFQLAATYGYGITMTLPFVEGNKRTGFLAAATFLLINGYRLQTTEVDATMTVLSLAAGELSEAEFVAWLTDRCVPLQRP